MPSYLESSREYFLQTGTRFQRSIIWAMGAIKLAAARANRELGLLDEDIAGAIESTARELMEGLLDDRIKVDVFQTGSGTGLNMNVNIVIARRASEVLGREVHPNDHVNLGQSSNDVVPSAVRIAAYKELVGALIPSLRKLTRELKRKEEEYKDVVRPGRTHLRDALPTTFGQFFGAYRWELEKLEEAFVRVGDLLLDIPIGGTAVGTGVNSHPEFPEKMRVHLRELTGISVRIDRVKSRSMRLLSDLTLVSGVLRTLAIDLHRLAQDIRLMFSGPATGFDEIELGVHLPGSSIMPGKVNPVTAEAVQMAASYVIGLDQSVTVASLLGELELSMGIPLGGWAIVREIEILTEAMKKIRGSIMGLKPKEDRCLELALRSHAIITILSPLIGYDRASELVELLKEGRDLEEIAEELGLDKKVVRRAIDPKKLTSPGFPARF